MRFTYANSVTPRGWCVAHVYDTYLRMRMASRMRGSGGGTPELSELGPYTSRLRKKPLDPQLKFAGGLRQRRMRTAPLVGHRHSAGANWSSLSLSESVSDADGWRCQAGHPPAEEVVGVALGGEGGLVHGRHLARKLRRHGAQLDHARRLVHAMRVRFSPPLTASSSPPPHHTTHAGRSSITHSHTSQSCQVHSDQ